MSIIPILEKKIRLKYLSKFIELNAIGLDFESWKSDSQKETKCLAGQGGHFVNLFCFQQQSIQRKGLFVNLSCPGYPGQLDNG